MLLEFVLKKFKALSPTVGKDIGLGASRFGSSNITLLL
jgi:hypothetical protein